MEDAVDADSDRIPDLDQRAECRPRRDVEFAIATPVLTLVNDANPIGLELAQRLVEVLHVDGQMMKAFTIFVDKVADEIRFAAGAWALNEFELKSFDVEISEDEAFGSGVRLAAHRGRKVAHEKFLRLANVLDRQRDVIETREAVGRGRRFRLVEVWNLPELDQRAESGAWGNEGCGGPIGKGLLIDDADAIALHRIGQRLKMIHLDRQVMHPFAMLIDEPTDESFLVREVLDHLDRKTAEPDILPVKAPADLIVATLLVAKMNREVALEKLVRAID